jgi:SAM-dependent methyltransferase
MLRVMSLELWKAERSTAWGSAPFERIAHQLIPIHEHLVSRLAPRVGDRWLDVATGTGAVAIRAARAGAQVTGLDFAAELLETARWLARRDGLEVEFDRGDAEQLPYPNESFDVVSSSVGAIFAPNHETVASELARVLGPGGRLGLVAWRPDPEWAFLNEFRPSAPPEAGDSDDWGREEYAAELLGNAFELRFEEGDCPLTGDSPEAVWDLVTSSVGPMKALVESLEPHRREELRRAELDHLDQYRDDEGVRRPQAYLLILGRRRT